MTLTKPSSFFEVNIALSGYVVKRLAEGLPGLPSHPRTPDQLAKSNIADAIGVDRAELDHPKVKAHLDALRGRYGKAGPSDAGNAAAMQKIAQAYRDGPLPRSGIGVNVDQLVQDTGLKAYRLRRGDVERFILLMAATQGLSDTRRAPTNNETLIDIWAAKLRAEGRRVPVSGAGDMPYYAQIGREAGLPVNQIQKKELKERVRRISDELGLEPIESLDDQLTRLRDHVDDAISRGEPMPRSPKGPAYKRLAAELRISKNRLEATHKFRQECERWLAAFPHRAD